ncbi:MAG: EAL domain-containing protein [Cryobacterium sp.]
MGAGLAGAIGVAVLVAWYAVVGAQAAVPPGFLGMKPTAALALVLLSVALIAYDNRRLSMIVGASVLAVGGLTLAEYVLDTSLRIDTLLPGIDMAGATMRMAPSSALSLAVLGAAVISSHLARHSVTIILAIVALCVSQIAILGYVYGVSSLYSVGGYTSMAPHTAVSLALLSAATLFQEPAGLAGLARDRGSAGRLLRSAVPFFIYGPFVLGWLGLGAHRLGWFDTPFTVAVLVLSTTLLGCAVTWLAARRLRELDRQRDGALHELAETNRMLETTVAVRTHELAETADALQALVRVAPVGIVQLDTAGRLLTVNDQWLSLSGLTLAESVNDGWITALHPDDAGRVTAEWGENVSAGTAYEGTVRFRTPEGQVKWVQFSTTPTHDEGVVSGHLASITDVTALRAAEEAASAARARFEAAFAWSPLGTAIVSLDGLVLEGNRRLFELTGRSTGVVGAPIEEIFAPVETPGTELPAGGFATSRQRVDRRMRRVGADEIWVKVSIAEIHDGEHVGGTLYQLEDITARRLAEARVEHLAFHDPLTNLPNRLLLLDRLAQALAQASRHGRGVAVLFIDLDRFKVVNDSLGHAAGDAVLTEVAARLRQGARATDTVARIGGDEFVVVCPNVASSQDVAQLAAAIQQAVALPIPFGEHIASVDASIGIAYGVGHEDPESLLQDADQAMYLAKDRGRARYEVFDDDLRGRIHRRLDTEIALRDAVDLGQIETWYQPIVDIQERRVVATEALARWRRPERGLVLPGDFISIAEDVGLIKQIGTTVLGQACLAQARLEGHMAVSVNVSPLQFVRDDFGSVVRRALSSSGLAPDQLWLELTESAVMEAIGSAARTFQELRDLGVRLAIDDFGTGFSSFAHLRAFTVDLLKIDMTFVRDIEHSDHDRAIVQGVLRLGESLKLDVVAEGIETSGQLELLQNMGCRFGQGHLFAKPSPSASPVIQHEDFLARPVAR